MPRKKHDLAVRAAASRQFTDREPFLDAFKRARSSLRSDRQQVLAFFGFGGIGKSRLLLKLIEGLREAEPIESKYLTTARTLIDFQYPANRVPAKALERLRAQLHDGFGVSFPTFDIAFAMYWRLANPTQPLASSELRFLSEGEIAGDIVSALQDVPIVGALAKIPRIIDKASRATRDWWIKRGKAELANIRTLEDPREVVEWLAVFLSADLKAWLAEVPSREAVLFFDTHEALWETQVSGGSPGSSPDEWLRDLVSHLEGTLVVIAGRNQLDWIADDSSWDGLIEQHLICELAPEDADSFLRTAGIAEADVRAAIVSQSRGLPLYLDLAVDTYEQLREREGRVPQPDEFDQNLERLLERLLAYLKDAQKAALYVLYVPETFDQARFTDLMIAFPTGLATTAYGLESITSFSFVEEPEPGQFALHAMVREALAQLHAPEERKRIQRHLLDAAQRTLTEAAPSKVMDDEALRAFREGAALAIELLPPDQAVKWVIDAEDPFDTYDLRIVILVFRAALRHSEQHLGEHELTCLVAGRLGLLILWRSPGEAEAFLRRAYVGLQRVAGHDDTREWMLLGLAHSVQAQVRWDEAHELFEQSAKLSEKVRGSQHETTRWAYHGLATFLIAVGRTEQAEAAIRRALDGLDPESSDGLTMNIVLGSILADGGELAAAETLLRRVVDRSEATQGAQADATVQARHHLAGVLLRLGALEEAERLARACLRFYEEDEDTGFEHLLARPAAGLLATILHAQGRDAEAEPLSRFATEKITGAAVLTDASLYRAMTTRAAILQALHRDAEAEELLVRGLALVDAAFGPEYPVPVFLARYLGHFFRERSRHEEAVPLLKRAVDGATRTLGADHAETLSEAHWYAIVLQYLDRISEAEALFRKVIEGYERAHPPQNADALIALSNLGDLLCRLDRKEEAEPFVRRAFERSRAASGSDDSQVLSRAVSLARITAGQGRVEEAEALLRDAVQQYELPKNAHRLDGAKARHDLGQLLQEQERPIEALSFLERALEQRRAKLGNDHVDCVSTEQVCARVLHELGRDAEAEVFLRHVADIWTRVRGETHVSTRRAVFELIGVLRAQTLHAEAEPYLRRLRDATARAVGTTHPDSLVSNRLLAEVLCALGRHAEAEALARSTHERSTSTLPAGHKITRECGKVLAQVLFVMGETAECESLLRQLHQDAEQVDGESALSTVQLGVDLSWVLAANNKADQARACLELVLDRCRIRFGAADPNTQAVAAELAELCSALPAQEGGADASAEKEPV